jgi:nucleoid-associated protein YgaU
MTDAPSRNGLVAGSSNGAAAPTREQAAQSRRRYSPERRRRVRRRRLRGLSRLALLVLVILVAIWVGTRVANATSNDPRFSERTYVVHSGDTLWSVARSAYPGGHDLRELVYSVEQRNHLAGADIRPGEQIILPIVQ